MSSKFGITEVRQLVGRTEAVTPNIPDFEASGGYGLAESDLSQRSKNLMTFFKPILENADWSGGEGHDPVAAKRFETAKKLLASHAMLTRLQPGVRNLAREATTAGVDLPTFTRQLLLVITRAYAKLFTPELFGVIPLNGPTGRIHFKDYLYDSTYTGSTPNVPQNGRTDDTTIFNPKYYAAPEGTQANRIAFKYTSMDVTTSDHRVIAEWTDRLAEDAMSVFDDDADSSHMNHMAQEMARVIDRDMATSLINAVPSYNQTDFTAAPLTNPNYVALSPSEQKFYDEKLWGVGIQTVLNQILNARKWNDDGTPDWAIVGTNFALALHKLTFFLPFDRSTQEMGFGTGALRDLGTIKASGLRFLVDPMLAVTVQNATGDTTGANHCYFGRRPRGKNDVGLYWLPYVAMRPTRDLYDPQTGTTTKGVWNSYAIAQPNTGLNPASSQLGDVYGRLRIQ
jgi:hypothetical protein